MALGTLNNDTISVRNEEIIKGLPKRHIFLKEKAAWRDLPDDRWERWERFSGEFERVLGL